jgi:hypothetical protein
MPVFFTTGCWYPFELISVEGRFSGLYLRKGNGNKKDGGNGKK